MRVLDGEKGEKITKVCLKWYFSGKLMESIIIIIPCLVTRDVFFSSFFAS